MYNELYYSSYSIDGSYQERPTSPLYSVAYEYQYIKLGNMLRYRFPIAPQLSLHVNGFSSSSEVSTTTERLCVLLGYRF